MREIKFRGQRADNNEWVYGCLVNNMWTYSELSKYKTGTPVCEIITGEYESDCWEDAICEEQLIVQVKPETVGQFTGLKDKNGVEIYEGDIVKTNGSVSFSNPQAIENQVREIFKTDAGFTGIRLGSDFDKEYPSSATNWSNYTLWNIQGSIEVIGNIHENK